MGYRLWLCSPARCTGWSTRWDQYLEFIDEKAALKFMCSLYRAHHARLTCNHDWFLVYDMFCGCSWRFSSVGQGVLPDIKTYNAALSVIARGGREDVALALLNQMRIDGEIDASGVLG